MNRETSETTRDSVSEPRVRFVELTLRNFKAFSSYRIRLDRVNVLVGPNNAGKSTIIGCFRALEAALRTANAKRPVAVRGLTGPIAMGWVIPDEGIPITLENASTDYSAEPATATFRLSNGNALILVFEQGRQSRLLFEVLSGSPLRTTGDFQRQFPVSVGAVPTLGAVEHEEQLVERPTVERNLATHRASRNFRSYWWHHRGAEFEAFSKALADSWQGVTIEPPERDERIVHFWCLENRITRELYWLGFGFQVWCQLLTHILRHRDTTLVVLDEPETYLHPEVQRQLLGLLRDTGSDILFATHSTELLAEAEPSDIVIVDRRRPSARRVSDAAGVRQAYEVLGSRRTYEIPAISKSRRALFVEGTDFRLLRRIAGALGYPRLAASAGIAALELGGHRPQHALSMAEGIRSVVDDVKFAVLLDRDYRTDEEIQAIEDELTSLDLVVTLPCKEIENLLLDPRTLNKAMEVTARDRSERSGKPMPVLPKAEELLDVLVADTRVEAHSQYVARAVDFRRKSGLSGSTVTREATEWFEGRWNQGLESRLELIPGKDVLSSFNRALQERVGFALTPGTIADSMTRTSVHVSLAQLIANLNRFRSND